MKYRYVIIEDEPVVRRGTELKMKRTGLPFELVGEEDNGADGLELLRRLRPELAIIDMRMPDMDGAALMAQLRNEALPVELIVASGYSDFDYARAGIRADVCDYLLKPFSETELRAAVLLALQRIEARSPDMASDPARAHDMSGARRDDELKLLQSYLMGVPDRARTPDFNVLNIDPSRGRYLVIELASQARVTPERPAGLDELVELDAPGLPGHVFWICYARAGIAQAALDKLRVQLTRADSAGISLPCRDLDRLYAARRQAQEARRDHAIGARGVVSTYAESDATELFDAAQCERMLLALECGDREWFARLAMGCCADCARAGWSVNRMVRALRRLFAQALERIMPQLDSEPPTLFQFDYLSQRTANDADLPEALTGFIAQALSVQASGSTGELITRMRGYLDAHFDENLSLERVSQLFGISPGYASQLFSQRMGMSYVNYITSLRIEHARKLLSESRLDAAAIARKCGFGNAKYFYRVFKSQTGQTPNDYRQSRS